MGFSQSKERKPDLKSGGNRIKPGSPAGQEKHNSADSKVPLAGHATDFIFSRNSSGDRRLSSFSSTETGKSSRVSSDVVTLTKSLFRTSTIAAPLMKPSERAFNGVEVDDIEGHSNVSRPPPPPILRRLSELIDPEELTVDCQIHSPSGNLLAPEQWLVHPDRPQSLRERQENIMKNVRAASRLGAEIKGELEKPSNFERVVNARLVQEGKTTSGKCRMCCGLFGL